MTTTKPPPRDAAAPESALTPDAWQACLAVLRAVVADRAALAAFSADERKELVMLAGRVARPERHEVVRLTKALRRADRKAERAADEAALAHSGMRVQRKAPVYAPLWLTPPPGDEGAASSGPELKQERACYVCKTPYRQVHFFYDAMCPACGDFNHQKRGQTHDLTGRVALITGARVKIGYQAALMVLRAGARVIVTTRFPRDAAARFAREADFPSWRDRLVVHGLDLRHAPAVELFARHLARTEARLDIIINNACQTVRRPPAFYAHLLERETAPLAALPAAERALLSAHEDLAATLRAAPALPVSSSPGLVPPGGAAPGAGVWGSALLSQARYLDEDFASARELFPAGALDEDLQQVDLRAVNSWRLTLAEVSTPELLEVQLVNAVAPFILNSRLKPLMLRTANRDKHIVNVSAMEGQFYRAAKTDRHPHTNMAKAALNMMTRTSAPDYVKDGIHMNSVDTGWVTDEDPAAHAARKSAAGFTPPLDIVDGAARICDPFFSGLGSGQHAWGQFFKDYKPAPW